MVRRHEESENRKHQIRLAETKMEGKRTGGRHRLKAKDTVRMDSLGDERGMDPIKLNGNTRMPATHECLPPQTPVKGEK